MEARLPQLPSLDTVTTRLPFIFPEGTEERNYCIREMAARTVWVMLYAGAIDGHNRWIRPSQVTDMGALQAGLTSDDDRAGWYSKTLKQRKARPADAWYAPNSREPIRDETIRQGLIPTGAIIERSSLPVTSSLPRYALSADFAQLFDEALDEAAFRAAAHEWRAAHLSKSALSRIALLRGGAGSYSDAVLVKLPNGTSRNMSAGPSSVISKAVIEDFATRFLHAPALLWLSESRNKVVESDSVLAAKVGLRIDAAKALPDIILADLGPQLLVVFVEVVATNGPISQLRKEELTAIAREAGFDVEHLAFVTAFDDRAANPARALMPNLAWGSFAWFRTEPDKIVILRDGVLQPIANLR